MSDPVTNAQVEDVLSSIRRLVGENKRPATAQAEDPGPGRLVLTPQLRVSDHDVLKLDATDAVDPSEQWFEFEEPPFDDEPLDFERAEDADLDAEMSVTRHELVDQASSETEDATSDDQSIEAFFARRTPVPPSALSERIDALETAIARSSDLYEPEGDEDDDFAVALPAKADWDKRRLLDATGAPVQHVEDTAAYDDDDAQVLDEDALHELVADIVRAELKGPLVAKIVQEELQGDLGERITRNVRKMVRREIQRALTARELD